MRPSLQALSVVVASIACASCSPGLQRPSLAPVTTPAGVRFSLVRADAKSVALAGAFNQWSTSSHILVRDPTSNVWTLVVALPPGEHAFMFVVDGTQWITPPLADDFVDDGFGAKNGVVVVRGTERLASPKPEGEGG
jgi:1,4-alpha-glucan branching enzyme